MIKPKRKRIDNGQWWDRPWSLVEGCSPVSESCIHCWSALNASIRMHQKNQKMKARYDGLLISGKTPATFNGKIHLMWGDLNKPTPRQKPAVWSIWNDLFHEDVPFEFIYKAFERMLYCPQHFFIVCTKRSNRMKEIMPDILFHLYRNHKDLFPFDHPAPINNIMGMVTVEKQKYDYRIKDLLETDFKYRSLSIEPILDFIYYPWEDPPCVKLDFIVCGPETGYNARKYNPEWIEDLYRECKMMGIPFFDKRKEGWLAREFPRANQ